MQSKAATVAQYLAELPADRRSVVNAVRRVVLDNLDAGFDEGMQYGMIGYFVPHARFPAGYHCDPSQPLPFAALAAQKNAYSLYMMGLYGDANLLRWFTAEWKKTGKKLDMGKSCIRFKKAEDLALDVIAQTFRKQTLDAYIAMYESTLDSRGTASAKRSAAKKHDEKKQDAKKSTAKKASARATADKSAAKRSAASKTTPVSRATSKASTTRRTVSNQRAGATRRSASKA